MKEDLFAFALYNNFRSIQSFTTSFHEICTGETLMKSKRIIELLDIEICSFVFLLDYIDT